MKNKTLHVSMAMPVDFRFGREILQGLLEANRANRWHWGITSPLWNQEEVWTLGKNQIPDAVIGTFTNENRVAPFRKQGSKIINIAGIDREPEGVHTVTADNLAVGRMAAAHFLERGFRSFAYVRHVDRPASRLRLQGFREGLGDEMEVRDHQNIHQKELAAFLKSLPPLTAIFCFQDMEARCVANVLDHLGKSIPEEYAILGVNDDPIDNGLSPVPISSIDIRPLEIGRRAAETLHGLLQGKAVPRRQLIPPGALTVRRSSEIYAINDPSVTALLRRIRERACEGIRVHDVVRPQDGSRRGMEMKFKRYVGRTIEAEIRRCRLEASRTMLLGSTKSISEIADACGFCNTPHFSRMFRDTYGIPPGEYRSE